MIIFLYSTYSIVYIFKHMQLMLYVYDFDHKMYGNICVPCEGK